MSRTEPSTLISLNKSSHATKRTKIKRIVWADKIRKQSREQKEERRRRRQADKVGV